MQAQTGTGKTLAYLLPVVSALRANVPFQVGRYCSVVSARFLYSSCVTQVLIMAPTRELAVQIQGVLQMLQSASPTPAFTYCCALPGDRELQQDADMLLEKKVPLRAFTSVDTPRAAFCADRDTSAFV